MTCASMRVSWTILTVYRRLGGLVVTRALEANQIDHARVW